jgi:hypothetical protein
MTETKTQIDVDVALLELFLRCEREDSEVRKRQLRLWKRNDKFWHGIQQICWSEAQQDWLAPSDMPANQWSDQMEFTESEYDYVVNIYKAHGESIIAALSAQVPVVRFPPDDADNEEDLIAASAYNKIADLLAKHNNAKLIQLQALLCLWNEGLVAGYHYNETSPEYGKVQSSTFKTEGKCATCGYTGEVPPEQLDPGESAEAGGEEEVQPVQVHCPECQEKLELNHVLDGTLEVDKSRTKIDIFGPLNVKIPYYARTQKECGYLILYQEVSRGKVIEMFEDLLDDDATMHGDDAYERAARTPSSYTGITNFENNQDLITLRRAWLRPCEYYELGASKKEEIDELKKLYPEGVMVTLVGQTILDKRPENLDKHWTIGKATLSRFIHSDAMGQPLIPIQEMTNTLANLTEETIEHGIPTSYADQATLDFESYGRMPQRPGMIVPVTRTPGEKIDDSFYTGERATLSKEVGLQGAYLEKMGQFVTGSFPSIYGGDAKSRTASEYSQSRQMALQRLSITWTFFNFWWAQLTGKAAKLYVEGMIADEKFTKKVDGNYVTVWIRRAELTGKIGDVEPEGDDSFPISTAAKQALLMKLIELQNPFLDEALYDVSNRPIIATALGFPEIHIPGEAQRMKQAIEIQRLNKGENVVPRQFVDDHQIHVDVCKAYLASLEGQELERTNPAAYELIYEHLTIHMQMMMQEAQMMGGGAPPDQGQEPPPEGAAQ